MPEFPIRKIAVMSEEISHDGGPAAASVWSQILASAEGGAMPSG